MKNPILVTLSFLLVSLLVHAQSFKAKYHDYSFNFYEVTAEAEAYFNEHGTGEGSGHKGYERWKNSNEYKFAPSGDRSQVDPYFLSKAWAEVLNKSSKISTSPAWRDLGPYSVDSISGHYSAGIGRVESFYVDPSDNQKLYLGSRSGGFWRSNNGGQTWISSSTDFLVASGVNTMTVNPDNVDSVLINVRNANNGTSHGVHRSTDGGATWSLSNFSPTALGWGGLGDNNQVYKIAYHPRVKDLVFVGTSRGLYRSTDDLQTFTQLISSADVIDIKFHPSDNQVIYIYDDYYWGPNQDLIMRSDDGGLTFSNSATLTGNNNAKVQIAVSPACADCLYAASGNGVWKSTDKGANFTFMTNPAGTCDGFAVHDQDTATMIYGMLDVYASYNGGTSFQKVAWWAHNKTNRPFSGSQYVHADLREIECINGDFYIGTDGFMSKTTDKGSNWSRLSSGTGIREFYDLGVAQSHNLRNISGSQDNGTSIRKTNHWLEFYGADGMDGIIHPLNPDYMMGSVQYGTRRLTFDGGLTQTAATPSGQSGAWEAPLVFAHSEPMTIYSFGEDVFYSSDFGKTWTNRGTSIASGVIDRAAVAYNDANVLAVVTNNKLEISTDGGFSFTNRYIGLPASNIVDVTFAPHNDSIILVAYANHQNDSKKVYVTLNQGASWTNITDAGIGNMPIRSVAIDHTPAHNLYIGAEIGVFTKPLQGGTWTLYNTSLPNCAVKDLEIMFGSNTLRAATWGRGMWETDLVGRSAYPKINYSFVSQEESFISPKFGVDQYINAQINSNANLSSVYATWSDSSLSLDSLVAMQNIGDSTWQSVRPITNYPIGTKLYFKVFAVGSANDTSETIRFCYTVKPFTYCDAFGTGTGSATSGNYIDYISLGAYQKVSGKEGYGNFTNEYIALSSQTNYQFLVALKHSPNQDSVHAWIDYNKNGDFDSDELIIFPGVDPNNQSIASFTTRPWLGVDTLRMRVISQRGLVGPTACGDFEGEVEDYSVVITGSGIGLNEPDFDNGFAAYPNPFDQSLAIEWEPWQADDLEVRISNSKGQIVFEKHIESNTGKLNVDSQSWPKGVYVVQFESAKMTRSQICIKK
jgi:hypothetical protein